AGAERAPDLREALGAEEQQCQEEQTDDLHGADVWHGAIVAGSFPDRAPPQGAAERPLATMSAMALLELEELRVALEDGTEIVKGVDLRVSTDEVHAIMGPNGSGKSTLAYAIAGHPGYEITGGRILLDGQDITEAGADERAQKGL